MRLHEQVIYQANLANYPAHRNSNPRQENASKETVTEIMKKYTHFSNFLIQRPQPHDSITLPTSQQQTR